MLAFDRCRLCLKIAEAVSYGKKFEVVAASHRDSPDFRETWDEAVKNMKLGAKKMFKHKYKILCGKRSGIRLSRFLWFITISEWNRWYHNSPKAMGYTTQKLQDEFSSTLLEGVLVVPTEGVPLHSQLVVEHWSEKVRFLVEKQLGCENRVTESQPKKTFQAMCDREVAKQCPDSALYY